MYCPSIDGDSDIRAIPAPQPEQVLSRNFIGNCRIAAAIEHFSGSRAASEPNTQILEENPANEEEFQQARSRPREIEAHLF
jgi:hypothetical protein